MKKPIKTYDAFDVVVVPFPFIDSAESKRRPAVVLSVAKPFNEGSSSTILAMITSSMHSPWPCDVEIGDLAAAGLPAKSLIRMKLFTLDNRLILKKIGRLASKDHKALMKSLQTVFPF